VSELQQSRYDRLVRRAGGLIGPGSKVSDALSDLFPVIDVENMPGELLRLMETKLLIGGTQFAATAGNTTSIQVFNPADSGNLVVVSTAYVSGTSADNYVAGVSVAEFGTFVQRMVSRDTRGTKIIQGVAQIKTTSGVAFSSAGALTWRSVANSTHTLDDANGVAILFPGTGFFVQKFTNASIMNCGFLVRERPFLQSELLE